MKICHLLKIEITQGDNAKQNKSEGERQILDDFTSLCSMYQEKNIEWTNQKSRVY